MTKIELKVGDILLLPTKYTEVYSMIAGVLGANVTELIPKLIDNPYLHAELYIGNGYSIAAWLNGVHVVKYPLSTLMKFDIYRHKDDKASEAVKKVILEDFEAYLQKKPTRFLNKTYDFKTLFYNTIAELADLLKLEKVVERKANTMDTPDSFICSELVARIYNAAGYDLQTNDTSLEWISPSDLIKSPLLYKVL